MPIWVQAHASGWTKHDNVMHSWAVGAVVDTGDADDVDLLLGQVVTVQHSVIEERCSCN